MHKTISVGHDEVFARAELLQNSAMAFNIDNKHDNTA